MVNSASQIEIKDDEPHEKDDELKVEQFTLLENAE